MPKYEDRPNLVQRTIYFNKTLDIILLDHLLPHFAENRGNSEAIRLMKLGLQVETTGVAVGAIHRPASPFKIAPTPIRSRRVAPEIVASDKDLQEAQQQAFLDFGGFPED